MMKKILLFLLSFFLLSCSLSVNPHKKSEIKYFKNNFKSHKFSNEYFTLKVKFIFNLMDNFEIFDADMRSMNILPIFVEIEKEDKNLKFNFEKWELKDGKGRKYKIIKLKEVWKRVRKFYKIRFYNRHMTETFNEKMKNLLIENSNFKILKGFLLFNVPSKCTPKDFSRFSIKIEGKLKDRKRKWEVSKKR